MASFSVMIFSFWHLLAVTLSLLYKQIARNFVYSSGDFSHKDEQRLGWPNENDDDQIKAIIESHRHKLKEIHLTKRINACQLHLERNGFDPFLKRIITGD